MTLCSYSPSCPTLLRDACPVLSLCAGAAPMTPGTIHSLQGCLLSTGLPPLALAPTPGASPAALPPPSPSLCTADPEHPVNLWVELPIPPHLSIPCFFPSFKSLWLLLYLYLCSQFPSSSVPLPLALVSFRSD